MRFTPDPPVRRLPGPRRPLSASRFLVRGSPRTIVSSRGRRCQLTIPNCLWRLRLAATARQPELIRNPMESVGEEDVIGRLRYDLIDRHGVCQGENRGWSPPPSRPAPAPAPACQGRCRSRRRVQCGRAGREQPVAITQIDRHHARLDAHFPSGRLPDCRPARTRHLDPSSARNSQSDQGTLSHIGFPRPHELRNCEANARGGAMAEI